MKRILSIDWDYFINATAFERATLFPDGGNENISYQLQDFIWDSRYSQSSALKNIGILKDDYALVHRVLLKFINKIKKLEEENLSKTYFTVTVSHRWIYDIVMEATEPDEEFEVYNIDFHHDMYCYKVAGQDVNCGNWVNCLLEQRQNMQYHWIKREDSDDETIGGVKVDCADRSLKDIEDLDFDYVFICRSDCWSPPHLDTYFDTLWALAKRDITVAFEQRIWDCRKISTLSEVEKKFGLDLALAQDMKKYPNATCISCGAIIPEGSSSFTCDKCNAR